jgi:hypothetical protein
MCCLCMYAQMCSYNQGQKLYCKPECRNGTGTSFDDGGRPEFDNVTGMFTPDPYLAENFKLVGVCLLATVLDDKIVVRLMNTHKDPVTLKANVPVGVFEILSYDELERPYEDAIDEMLSRKSKCARCDSTRCVCSDMSDEWDSEPGYDYYSQSRVNAARARGAYYDEMAAAAAKLHLKSDDELINEIDVGDAETSATDKTLIIDVLRAHMNVFARSKRDHGRVKMVQFTIDTGSSPPLRSGLRPMSPPQREIVETQINEMLDDGIIEPSYGPWSSPIVLVKKKSGETRFYVDYRKLNAVTIPDCYPLPLIVDALDSLGGAKFFSTLDCQSEYWQIEVDPQDRVKTTFSSHYGNYHFTLLPFGVTNAPAFFQRTMDCILSGLTWKKCLIYIDDVIVFGKTVVEHNDNLVDVFTKLEQAGLKLNPKNATSSKRK